nr:hypothetical protein [Actinomycetales bacterium]
MADLLIRNVSPETLKKIDAAAEQQGLSRAAFLRQQLDAIANPLSRVTMAELKRSARLAEGALDEDLMRGAWE